MEQIVVQILQTLILVAEIFFNKCMPLGKFLGSLSGIKNNSFSQGAVMDLLLGIISVEAFMLPL